MAIYDTLRSVEPGTVETFLSNLNYNFENIWKIIYPKGSFFWTTESDFDPNTKFGGTWERIKDRMVLAVGDTYTTTEQTGGSATVTLTEAQLPHIEGYLGNIVTQDSGGLIANNKFSLNTGTSQYTFSYKGQTTTTVSSSTELDGVRLSFGRGQPHDNMPPYYTAYCWHRTA